MNRPAVRFDRFQCLFGESEHKTAIGMGVGSGERAGVKILRDCSR